MKSCETVNFSQHYDTANHSTLIPTRSATCHPFSSGSSKFPLRIRFSPALAKPIKPESNRTALSTLGALGKFDMKMIGTRCLSGRLASLPVFGEAFVIVSTMVDEVFHQQTDLCRNIIKLNGLLIQSRQAIT